MIDYQTIVVLVNQIPTDTWDVLKQIKERPSCHDALGIN